MALLDSLGAEKQRWEAGSQTFKNQMDTIIGDVLLSSAFMAYAGGCLSCWGCHSLLQDLLKSGRNLSTNCPVLEEVKHNFN